MTRVDERGHYELRGLPGTSRLLYFVPMQGSLAVLRVRLPNTNVDAKPLQVVIGPPCCTLRVHVVDAEGKQARSGLLIRYNGEFVPGAILRFVISETGMGWSGEALLPRLPAGSYEVWAIGSEEEEVQLIASAGSLREPVRVGLSGGEQTVTVGVGR